MINLNFIKNKRIFYPVLTCLSITISSLPVNATFPKEASPETTIEQRNSSCLPGTFPQIYQFEISNNTRYVLTYRIDDRPSKLAPGGKKKHVHQYAYYLDNCKFNYVKKPHIRFLKKANVTERQILWQKESYSFEETVLDSGEVYVDLVAN